jgi:copper homeostasis protein
MRKVLEVIVTSAEEARVAEGGGANRLELIRDLHLGGLSPSISVVDEVLAAVSITVRVMVRNAPSFSAGDETKLKELAHAANQFRLAGASAFVIGFVKEGMIDEESLEVVLRELPGCKITFHRAIETVNDPYAAVSALKGFHEIDRILTSGPAGDWDTKQRFLEKFQAAAAPEIRVITGGGLDQDSLARIATSQALAEFHVGTAARDESGTVTEQRVRRLRRLLDA